jgi:hypothetical protein
MSAEVAEHRHHVRGRRDQLVRIVREHAAFLPSKDKALLETVVVNGSSVAGAAALLAALQMRISLRTLVATGLLVAAVGWAARIPRLQFNLEEIQKWEDEWKRILVGDLDYQEIISGHLGRLERVRREFQAMDENTY